MRVHPTILALALALAACAAGKPGSRSLGLDAPCAGLVSADGGLGDLGAGQGVPGPGTSAQAMALVRVEGRSGEFDLVGSNVQIGRLYALVGEAADEALVCAGREVDDCDDCTHPRYRAVVVRPPRARPLLAVGPVERPLPHATARPFGLQPEAQLQSNNAWTREIVVDLDGDGAPDLERVVRCGRHLPSGCDASVCGQTCVGTRAVGASEPRAIECREAIPDVDDCR